MLKLLTEKMILKIDENPLNPNGFSWVDISQDYYISEEIMRKHFGYLSRFGVCPWYNICHYQNLSEKFIRDFSDKVHWVNISYSQKLSEDFIREFSDKVDWINISCYQKLSEDFIREFSDKVDWHGISIHQKLSENFIREFSDKVYLKYIPLCCFSFENKISWRSFI